MAPQTSTEERSFTEPEPPSKVDDESLRYGQYLSNPPPGEEVVISGMAGNFPDSANVAQLKHNLYNKIDMVAPYASSKRGMAPHPEIPTRGGNIVDIEKFDAGYFGVHNRQAHSMDPMARVFLEKCVEAIIDAGVNPKDLEGSKTGVFLGVCLSESEPKAIQSQKSQHYGLVGTMRSIIANRVSYFLKLKGPSYVCDAACSSSIYGLQDAYQAIRTGKCDAALVGGTNVCLLPYVSLQFARLGVLSPDGVCKCFDDRGDGYARSEAICAIFLQKSKDAKRIYANVVHSKTSCDGYKETGISYPSGLEQASLLRDFYEECNIDPTTLSYLEAHSTGTKVGDPEEIKAIDAVFCKNRKTPLLVGSVKSNIGHTEPTSGLCSILKCIFGMETNSIPPNIHYFSPRIGVEALESGRLKVVTECTPFEDDRGLMAIDNFGFGGANSHILLKWNTKTKINKGRPDDDLPRLVCVSGRVEETIHNILNDVAETKLDAEYVKLLHSLYSSNHVANNYRGYSIVTKDEEVLRSVKYFDGDLVDLYFVFSNLDNCWQAIGKELLGLPIFRASIQRINEILSTKNINVLDIITKGSNIAAEKLLGGIVVQIGIVEILKTLEIVPNKMFGHSISELICAYFDEALTLEETINASVAISTFANDNQDFGKRQRVLEQELSKIIPKPKRWSNKCVSKITGQFASAEYFVKTLINKISLKEQLAEISKRVVLFEIGAGQLEATTYSETQILSIANEASKNHLNDFLKSIGSLYELGRNPQLDRLYPDLQFPVSRGTPMLNSHIKWDHSTDWFIITNKNVDEMKGLNEKTSEINVQEGNWKFIQGHVIDGRNLFPAMGYFILVWQTISCSLNVLLTSLNITFENCKFSRASTIPNPKVAHMQMTVMIQESGNFEIIESNTAIVTGRVLLLDEENEYVDLPKPVGANGIKMQTKDIYKELRLRGYNYHGMFQSLQECDLSASVGTVRWEDNWIALMDNMLQMQILQTDSRFLYVPTTIDKVVINSNLHLKYIKEFGENPDLPIYVYKEANIIRCGYIEIYGTKATSIALRKPPGEPVLEKYEFVPNIATLTIHQSVRVNVQIILENFYTIKFKVVELVDEATIENSEPLTKVMVQCLKDIPLIKPYLTILSGTPIVEPGEILVENKLLKSESDCNMVIATNVISRPEVLHEAFEALKENGYILTREALDIQFSAIELSEVNIVTVHKTDTEVLILLSKPKDFKHSSVINLSVDDNEFDWLPTLQNAVKNDSNVIVYAQNEPLSGILGLIKCVRKEPGGKSVKAVFIADDNVKLFDSLDCFYSDQLKKSMAINVYKNGQWGTYRHLLLENSNEVACNHSFVNSTVRGDLSSMRWMEGPLANSDIMPPEKSLVQIYYSSINFRDVMTASGKISNDVITMQRIEQLCVQGIEYSGRDMQGNRVMGMTNYGCMASMVKADSRLMWKVPDSWTLEEAATVPIVYGTGVYALFYMGRMRKGDSVLIHSGSGGVGLAAIQLCLHFGCTVYTTVGTPEKRAFVKQQFPQLTDQHFGNSRDTSFENMIMKATKGRGVDIVLNSLADEKLIASARCLARGGTFLEIGKFDMANNNSLNLLLFEKEASFHGVMLDKVLESDPHFKLYLDKAILKGIADGAVKPLPRTIFKRDDVEQAFRFMTSGKHMGKVMIQVRQEEEERICLATEDTFLALSKYYCKPENSYIIVGGLGGIGLELADWLVLRGARKLILTSRSGVTTGYQAFRIRIWTSYGVDTIVSTADVTTREGCEKLLEEAEELGPVHAVFNLAVVLKDGLLENQDKESFQMSFAPKALATKLLDEITRTRCPILRDFVVFSSVSCGRGNAEQTNYGMANSVMERICEKRKLDGFPAVAIEWGAIGDVGIVAEMQLGMGIENGAKLEIGGTYPQKISSCLNVLDIFLRQNSAPIVSSLIVAAKKGQNDDSGNIVDVVANIIGVNDIKSISMHATLAELGMDSMTAVEIQQTLEREFNVFLTAKAMRSATFNRLIELQEQKDSEMDNVGSANKSIPSLQFVLKLMDDEEIINLKEVKLETKSKANNALKVLLLSGIESAASVMLPLTKNFNCEAVGVQMGCLNDRDTLYEMAEDLIPTFEKHISKGVPFHIAAYSFGTMVALEVVNILETKGYKGKLILIDGGPHLMRHLINKLEVHLEDRFQTALICQVMGIYLSPEVVEKNAEAIFKCTNLNERFNLMERISEGHSKFDHRKRIATSIYKRIYSLVNWKSTFEKLQSKIILLRAKYHNSVDGLSEDYELSQLSHEKVEVHVIEANHSNILEKIEVADFITSIINN